MPWEASTRRNSNAIGHSLKASLQPEKAYALHDRARRPLVRNVRDSDRDGQGRGLLKCRLVRAWPWAVLVAIAMLPAWALSAGAPVAMPVAAADYALPSAAGSNHVTSGSFSRRLIVAVDPVTGDRAQVECDVPSNAFSSDVVLVVAEDILAVTQVCVDNPAAFGWRP